MDKVIKINNMEYVLKSSIKNATKVPSKAGKEFCIVRTYSAGVFAGWINRKFKGKEATIYEARRIWYWAGANSLSQLANDGTKKPEDCKFTQVNAEVDLKEIIEVIPCTTKAKASIEGVSVWQK